MEGLTRFIADGVVELELLLMDKLELGGFPENRDTFFLAPRLLGIHTG